MEATQTTIFFTFIYDIPTSFNTNYDNAAKCCQVSAHCLSLTRSCMTFKVILFNLRRGEILNCNFLAKFTSY